MSATARSLATIILMYVSPDKAAVCRSCARSPTKKSVRSVLANIQSMKQSSHATSLSGKNVTVKDRKLAEKFMRVTANPNMTKGEDNDYMDF